MSLIMLLRSPSIIHTRDKSSQLIVFSAYISAVNINWAKHVYTGQQSIQRISSNHFGSNCPKNITRDNIYLFDSNINLHRIKISPHCSRTILCMQTRYLQSFNLLKPPLPSTLMRPLGILSLAICFFTLTIMPTRLTRMLSDYLNAMTT